MISVRARVASLQAAVDDSSRSSRHVGTVILGATPVKPAQWGTLECCHGTCDFSRLELTGKEVLIGRKEGCHVRYAHDAKVSSLHCCLYVADEAIRASAPPVAGTSVWVEDLSANGVFVNGMKVGKGHKLEMHHLDVISLLKPVIHGGEPPPYVFRLHLNATPDAAAAAQAPATPPYIISGASEHRSARSPFDQSALHQGVDDEHEHAPLSLHRWLLQREI